MLSSRTILLYNMCITVIQLSSSHQPINHKNQEKLIKLSVLQTKYQDYERQKITSTIESLHVIKLETKELQIGKIIHCTFITQSNN